MRPEFGEVEEPAATVGSSTMPHKRNPHLVAVSAAVRALVPLALGALQGEHEADGAAEWTMFDAVTRACVLTGAALPRLHLITAGLRLDERRMRANTGLTAGALTSEAVMLELGAVVGRQVAHAIVAEAARVAAGTGRRFDGVLAADPSVAAHLDPAASRGWSIRTGTPGLSTDIAVSTAARARETAAAIRAGGGAPAKAAPALS
ncbi:hypothetical protein ACFPIJ_17300 [Dactylosporangium cerinum]|uniref:Adenylosuccinate lyase C-terminal domain-containing protein n=1 Tax=Dactylosporangium cerinum TaxID=1434730 RepID=A0ABV9VWJ9_9ACTN